MKKFDLIFGSIFGGVGAIFLIIGIIMFIRDVNFMKRAITLDATISNIETYTSRDSDGKKRVEYDVYVQYSYEGNEYEDRIDEYGSSMSEGAVIPILIDPKAPGRAVYKEMVLFGSIIMTLLGSVCSVIGLCSIIGYIKGRLLRKKAIHKGKEVYATVTEIRKNYNVRINGRHPVLLICEYQEGMNKYVFRSESQKEFDNNFVGKRIRVYYLNEKQYYVDLESLELRYKGIEV